MQGVGAETGSHEDRVPLPDPSCSPFGHIPLEVRAIRGSIADLPSACGVQKSRNCGGAEVRRGQCRGGGERRDKSSDSKTVRPPGLCTKPTLYPSIRGGPATKMLPVCLRALLSPWGAAGVFLLLQAVLRLHLNPKFPVARVGGKPLSH